MTAGSATAGPTWLAMPAPTIIAPGPVPIPIHALVRLVHGAKRVPPVRSRSDTLLYILSTMFDRSLGRAGSGAGTDEGRAAQKGAFRLIGFDRSMGVGLYGTASAPGFGEGP